MKEFISAVQDELAEEAPVVYKRDAEGQFILDENGEKIPEEPYLEFKLDDRVCRAYPPTPGQLTFMLAALGRGQSDDSRFASIMNILLESLRQEDADYIEGRLLTRDPKQRLPLEKIEEVFEYLVGEWFARPTQP